MARFPRIIAGVLALTLVAAACGDNNDDTGTINLDDSGLTPATDEIQTEEDGDSLRGITFATLDGGTDSFDDHLGQPLVVNFFAAWCPPCRAEMPEFEEVFQEFAGEVGFLGISRDPTPQASIDLIAETGVTYAAGWDKDDTLFPTLRLFAMPTTLFVNPDGTIVATWAGVLTADSLREMIEDELL